MPEEAGRGLAEDKLDQKVGKRASLMRCQTEASGAGITADSVMEGAVGGNAIVGVGFWGMGRCGGWILGLKIRGCVDSVWVGVLERG